MVFSDYWRFVCALVCLFLAACSKQTPPSEPARPVRTLVVSANQQHLMAEYSGSVVARVESQLGFRVGGKIKLRKVEVGSQVKPGDVLMQLDTQDLILGLNQAQANVHTAHSNFILAEKELKRFGELLKTGAVSQSALDAKSSAFDAAKAYYEQAQAQLLERQNQTQYANLKADVAGVVTAIQAEIGQVVAAGAPVVSLAQVAKNTDGASDMEIAIEIPENNLSLINKAEAIEITLWALRKEIFKGHIREMAPAADPISRTFSAKISFVDSTEAQRKLLKLGMTATAKFLLTTPQAYIKVPLSALLNSQGKTLVWQVKDGKAEPVEVTVAGISGNEVLLKGLQSGQTIITAGVHVLTPGRPVTLLPPAAAAAPTGAPISAHAIMAPNPEAPAATAAEQH